MALYVEWPGWPDTTKTWVTGGDTIQVASEPIQYNPGPRQLVGLQTDPKVTWLKRIRVLKGDDEKAVIETVNDNHGPVYVDVSAGDYLEFVKAKTFGVPTGMYRTKVAVKLFPVRTPPDQTGWTLLFTWNSD